MCGIFGIVHADRSRPVEERQVAVCTDLMRHRGPDDAGYWCEPGVGLGHRRLSIIDLSPLGHQPMFNEEQSIGLVYNGEIYNYRELYQELVELGHRFRSKSDTEVIIHAYEEWGTGCLSRFNGMFAFALWDRPRRLLWGARDRLGIKPFYYYHDGESLVFASEVKPILATGAVRSELNEKVLDAYFSLGYVPGPETMFQGIRKLTPGHFLTYRDGRLEETEYWDFAQVEPLSLPDAEYQGRIEELFRDSVSLRLRSDVPLGVFLSGGLDSSAVVATMSELVTDPVNTFTVGYDQTKSFSEEPYAAQVAERFGTKHHVFRLEPDDFLGSLRTLVEFAEEPIVEPAAIALYRISQMAREKATVLLSGEGSDEILAGYYLYDLMLKIERLQRVVPSCFLKGARWAARLNGRLKPAKYGDWLNLGLEERYHGTSSYLTGSMKDRLYAPGFLSRRGGYLDETFARHFAKVAHLPDPLSRMLYVDAKTWLADDLLVKADKMTMAASIELRVPFLDYRMVELATSFPSRMKLAGGSGKAVLKSMMRPKLPAEIVDRKKMGFPVPVGQWFGNELAGALASMRIPEEMSPWLDPARVESALAGREGTDGSRLVMSLLVFKAWKEKYLS
ncbi:amidotransferase 1, exosortase A system-associated [Geomonas sp. Red276]